MARYIKLEDAIEVCGKYKDLHKKENSRLGMSIVNEIYLDIDNLPTADVEEVKHGYWTGRLFYWGSEEEYPILEKSHYLVCSECGYRHYLCVQDFFGRLHKVPTGRSQIIIPNGCPNCLAKMDGGKEE